MTDAGSWVCGNCRSINPMRSGNCYSCRSPRSLAIDPTAPAPPKTITDESPLEDELDELEELSDLSEEELLDALDSDEDVLLEEDAEEDLDRLSFL